MLLAHRECFDHLRWELRLAETYPQPKLTIDGDKRFEAYLQGLVTKTPIDRAVTAIVQSLSDIVAAVTPASIRLRARGEAAVYTHVGRDRMLRSIRLNIRRRMRKAIKHGFNGLEALRDGRKSYREGFFDICDLREDEYEAFEEVEKCLEPIAADAGGEPSLPSLKLVKKAVRFVCSSRVPFEIVIAGWHPLTFKVKGGQTFKSYVAGKRLDSDPEVARTAVAQAIDRLVPQFDEATLRGFFPDVTTEILIAAPMRTFILKRVREAIDTAVANASYSGLTLLQDWRIGLIDLEDARVGLVEPADEAGDVGPIEAHEPNEIDELLRGIKLPEHIERRLARLFDPGMAPRGH